MTILFESDWLKHPNAIIDYSTSNTSFLRIAEVYYKMGVKNCAFHLSLLDPDLQGVDPFSPDLTFLQKGKIARECKNNFWYYLREVERVRESGNPMPVQYRATRMSIALYWLYMNHVMTIAVILRQTGKTTALASLAKYLLNFGSVNTLINLLTKSEGLKSETLLKIKALYEELPDYLNFSTKKDIFNTDEIYIKGFENKLKGSLSSSSPKQAEKVGRGFTAPTNLIDEAAFIENIAIALGALLMSGNDAREAAKRNNKPYGTILATTAGNIDDRDGSYIYGLVTSSTLWAEPFLDAKDITELMHLIYTNSSATGNVAKRPMVNITMSYRQLGYDDAWLERTKQANISTPENLRRDLFNEWLSGSTESPIPKEYLEPLRNSIVEFPKSHFFAPHNYLLRWYIEQDEVVARSDAGSHFVISVDTSDGQGADDISFVVSDHQYGDVVCTANFNELNLITLADFFVAFLLRYENSTMIIERRSSAIAIIDYMISKLLLAGENPYDRLFNFVYQDKDKFQKEYDEIKRASLLDEQTFIKYKKYIGFATSGSGVTSRSELYSTTLLHMLKYRSNMLYDFKIINQLLALVIRNGRIDHPPGGHDDMVVGALLGHWFMTQGKNLNLYGLATNLLLKSNPVYLTDKYKSDDNERDQYELQQIEQEFNRLLEEYKSERDVMICRQIEARLNKLSSMVSINTAAVSVQELLDNINRAKRIRQIR